MRRAVLVLGSLGLGLAVIAGPASWASVDPPPNPYGWHNTAVTVTISAMGGPGLKVCYQVSGGALVCQPPTVSFTLSAEGVHTIKYWAEDNTGSESPKTLTVRIDTTPSKIRILSPTRDAKYLLHQTVTVEWLAYDRLSGLEFVEASGPSGSPLDTSSPGHQTFWVVARDRAGNTAREEVDYQVVCVIEAVLPSGFYIDRLLPPEERVLMWKHPVLARYARGEAIVLAFRLLDAHGLAGPWTRPNLLLTQVRPDPEFGEKHTIWDWVPIPYDAEAGFYRLVYDSGKRDPGVYDLWVNFGDGQTERIRIQILPEEGKEGS